MIPSKIAVLCLVGFVLLVNFIEARPAPDDDGEGHHGHFHVHKNAHPEQHQHHNHSHHHHVQANGDGNDNQHRHHHHYRVGGDKPHVHHHHYRIGGDHKPHVHHHHFQSGDEKPHNHHHHFKVGGGDKPEEHHFSLGGSESTSGNIHIHRYEIGSNGGIRRSNSNVDEKVNLDDLFRGFSPETIKRFKKILKDLNINISEIDMGGDGNKPKNDKDGDDGSDNSPDNGSDNSPDNGNDNSPDNGNDNSPDNGNDNSPDDGKDNSPDNGNNNNKQNGSPNNGNGSGGFGGGGIHKYDGKDSLQPRQFHPECDDSINDRYGVGKHFVRGARDVGFAILSEAEFILDPILNGATHGLGEGLKVALCAIENGFSDFGSDFDSATDIAKHGLVNFFKLQGPHPVLGIPTGIGGILGEAGKAIASIGGDAAAGIRDGLNQLTGDQKPASLQNN